MGTLPTLDLDLLPRLLRPLFDEFDWIAAVYLFGSAVRGELRGDSDLDLGLVTTGGSPDPFDLRFDLARLEREVEKRVGAIPIDLVLLERQGLPFQHAVLVTGRLIHEADRERRIDYQSDVLVHAIDFAPTYRIYLDHVAEGVKRRLGIP